MGNRLKNKIAIVTAAGQGIGKATAIAFHKEGAAVIATDLNETTLESLNKEYPEIKIKKLDSTDNNSIIEFTKSLKSVDILFNAVGFVHHGTILDCDEKDWEKLQTGDRLVVENVHQLLFEGISDILLTVSNKNIMIPLELAASERQRHILLAGGYINWIKKKHGYQSS